MSVSRDHSVVTPLTQITLVFTEAFTDTSGITLVPSECPAPSPL